MAFRCCSTSCSSHYLGQTALAMAVLSSFAMGQAKKTMSLTEATSGMTKHHETETPLPLSMHAPLSPIRVFRPNPNIEIAFDVRTRNPVYVLEKIQVDPQHNVIGGKDGGDGDGKTVGWKPPRRPRFYEETSLAENYRSRNSNYHLSGYDRGHLAPAADHQHSEQAFRDTFNLCNVSPQHPDMNRGIWANLESWIRDVATHVAREGNKTTFVVTGPLWLPHAQLAEKRFQYSYPAIGNAPSLVAVPTHFFKVVVCVSRNEISNFGCFVVPNAELPAGRDAPALSSYLVPWSDLETVTGLEFFPQWAKTPEWKARADALTLKVKNILPRKAIASKDSSLLLLTSGEQSPSPQKTSKHIFWGANQASLQHLCHDGNCSRFPRKRKQ